MPTRCVSRAREQTAIPRVENIQSESVRSVDERWPGVFHDQEPRRVCGKTFISTPNSDRTVWRSNEPTLFAVSRRESALCLRDFFSTRVDCSSPAREGHSPRRAVSARRVASGHHVPAPRVARSAARPHCTGPRGGRLRAPGRRLATPPRRSSASRKRRRRACSPRVGPRPAPVGEVHRRVRHPEQ